MRPITITTTISAPREQVYEELTDLSGRVAWSDHYVREYRLARANPRGTGAAARYRIRPPAGRLWVELELFQCDRPRLVRERGRYGRIGRSRIFAEWVLEPESAHDTRVELSAWTEPAFFDRLREALGGRIWLRRKLKKAVSRLREQLEDPAAEPGPRATVAGWEPAKHPRFGA